MLKSTFHLFQEHFSLISSVYDLNVSDKRAAENLSTFRKMLMAYMEAEIDPIFDRNDGPDGGRCKKF